MSRRSLGTVLVIAAGMLHCLAAPVRAADPCAVAGTWFDPDGGAVWRTDQLSADLADRAVVLLGEIHGDAEIHRWQLHTVAALHARNSDLAIGLEMLPRTAQPALDRWIEGSMSVAALLEETRWAEVWGHDPAAYLPVFHFARQHRVTMVALNVERALVSRVGREGWRAIPRAERRGVGDAAAAEPGYLSMLAGVYAEKAAMRRAAGADAPSTHAARLEDDPDFRRFVEAQQTWDRAMAEAIADRLSEGGVSQVVALVGRGHAVFGYGIPHQLSDLGVRGAAVLVAEAAPCGPLEAGVADAVFALGPTSEPAAGRPRLGVVIAAGEAGVLVREIRSASVAEAAGLAAGDIIVEAAGVPISRTGELVDIVRRQAPGTWLPLSVRRGAQTMALVAKFPVSF